MEEGRLHPDIIQFKQFVQEHPQVIAKMRNENKTLQQLFEEWAMLGSEHEIWEQYKEEETTSMFDTVTSIFRQMDLDQVQSLISQFSSALTNVQGLLQNFQQPANQQMRNESETPFSFRHD